MKPEYIILHLLGEEGKIVVIVTAGLTTGEHLKVVASGRSCRREGPCHR